MKIWQSLLSVCVQNKVVGNVLHHRGILPGYSKWSRNPSLLEVSEKWTKLAITFPINFTALVLFKHQNEDVICRRKVARSSLGETIYRLSVFGFPLLEWVGGGEGRGEGWRRLFGVLSPRYIRSKEMSVISYLISDLKTMKPERINNISVGCRHTFILHTGPTIPIPSSPPPHPPTHDSYPWHHKDSIQKFFKCKRLSSLDHYSLEIPFCLVPSYHLVFGGYKSQLMHNCLWCTSTDLNCIYCI